MSESDPSGFLGRWSRRKLDARQSQQEVPVQAETSPPKEPAISPAPDPALTPASPSALPAQPDQEHPPLTLEDVKGLTFDSDFTPFLGRNVMPDVKNAAMKKLFFSDPHFNVMDGLDTYIDDYTKFEPLTESAMRKMTSAKLFKLFEDEDEADGSSPAPERDSSEPSPGTVSAPHETVSTEGQADESGTVDIAPPEEATDAQQTTHDTKLDLPASNTAPQDKTGRLAGPAMLESAQTPGLSPETLFVPSRPATHGD